MVTIPKSVRPLHRDETTKRPCVVNSTYHYTLHDIDVLTQSLHADSIQIKILKDKEKDNSSTII